MSVTSGDVINFWFDEIDPKLWFKKDDQFDQHLRSRFSSIHRRAVQSELFDWRVDAEGRLGEIIVLDQFSRNMFRDSSVAFASDCLLYTSPSPRDS